MLKTDKFAVMETGGKQYLVKPGNIISVERLEQPKKGLARGRATAEGDTIHFDKVLLMGGEGETKLGDPYIKGVKIPGKFIKEGKGKKIINLRYHSKTRQQRRKGHRQIFTEVSINEF